MSFSLGIEQVDQYLALSFEQRKLARDSGTPGEVALSMISVTTIETLGSLMKAVLSMDGHTNESKEHISASIENLRRLIATLAANASTGDPRALDEALDLAWPSRRPSE